MKLIKYVGYALSAFAVLLLGYEILKYFERQAIHLMTLKQVWQDYDAESLDRITDIAMESPFPAFLGGILDAVVNVPLLSIVVITAAFLLFIGRHSDIVG
ncbi:MAG: hypothetical protein K9G26_10645 [Emcibacter sp.]|nr:hypothetical protein [Emcibacter sp.]